jgi:hypothetical protein
VDAVEEEHVAEWLAKRDAEVMPASHAAAFDAYLNGLPWLGSSPDWASIGATQLEPERSTSGPNSLSQGLVVSTTRF